MKLSTSFLPVQKDALKDAECVSHRLTVRAGLATQIVAGHYAFLPLGMRVISRIEAIVRAEMNAAGATEILLPIMQPASLWEESGRWEVYGAEMYKLKNRTGRPFCLGPTHEELVVSAIRPYIRSYRDLPVTVYQIGTKFRDELRPRSGLLRAREFLMKDAYSFDISDDAASESYLRMRKAYIRILMRMELNATPISAATGEMGGSFSEEFIAPSEAGEDQFFIDGDGVPHKAESENNAANKFNLLRGIEIGHIFRLGTRYSEVMNLRIDNATGTSVPLVMGCYGIGVSRMLPCVIEQHHDERGILWPKELRPFDVYIVPIGYDASDVVRQQADDAYRTLSNACVETILDDRNVSPGNKFHDADLLGIPYKLIVSARGQRQDGFWLELEDRKTRQKESVRAGELLSVLTQLLGSQ